MATRSRKRRRRKKGGPGDGGSPRPSAPTTEGGDVCPICLEPLRSGGPVETCRHGDERRGHPFHRACLTGLLRRTDDDRCPVCRQPCVGLRARLVTRHLWERDFETALAVLVGGAVGSRLPAARRERGLSDLGSALGLPDDDDRDFRSVLVLVRRSVLVEGALDFLLAVMDGLGLDPDARTNLPAGGGSETPLQWLVDRPRPEVLSIGERLRAVRLLVALGADAGEAWAGNGYKSSGDARIDLVLGTAIDAARAVAARAGGGFFNATDAAYMASVALGGREDEGSGVVDLTHESDDDDAAGDA